MEARAEGVFCLAETTELALKLLFSMIVDWSLLVGDNDMSC